MNFEIVLTNDDERTWMYQDETYSGTPAKWNARGSIGGVKCCEPKHIRAASNSRLLWWWCWPPGCPSRALP